MEKELRIEKQWNVVNTSTIVEWASASNLNILLLDTYLLNLRNILRFNTLWSLVISSITSTVSVTQFTISDTTDPYISLGIKILIFITSVITSLITGYIKVEKIQETIEQLEEHKKNWLTFMYSLTSELQVGMPFRNDATVIINAKKDEFNAASAKQTEIPQYIHKQVSEFLMRKRHADMRLLEVQEQRHIDDTYRSTISCHSMCCCLYWIGYALQSRCVEKTEDDYNIESIATKLSLFHSINKELKTELLELLKVFPDEIIELHFDRKNDMFSYKIINNRYEKRKEPYESVTVYTLKQGTSDESSWYTKKKRKRLRKSFTPAKVSQYEAKHRMQQGIMKRASTMQHNAIRIPLPSSPTMNTIVDEKDILSESEVNPMV